MSTKFPMKLQLIPILLRLEIGLPFALFTLPLNFIIGLLFVIANYYAENVYDHATKLLSKCIILVKACLYNALFLAIGWVIHCKFTYIENGEKRIDIDKIYAVITLVILIPLLMTACRCLFCYIDKLRQNKDPVNGN